MGGGIVLGVRIGRVLVGLTEPSQVGHDHVGGRRHERHDRAVVSPVPGHPCCDQPEGDDPVLGVAEELVSIAATRYCRELACLRASPTRMT